MIDHSCGGAGAFPPHDPAPSLSSRLVALHRIVSWGRETFEVRLGDAVRGGGAEALSPDEACRAALRHRPAPSQFTGCDLFDIKATWPPPLGYWMPCVARYFTSTINAEYLIASCTATLSTTENSNFPRTCHQTKESIRLLFSEREQNDRVCLSMKLNHRVGPLITTKDSFSWNQN